MNVFSRIAERYEQTVARTRERSGLVDHLWLTKDRYSEVLGGRLAAGIAYYGFFATFALGLLAYAVLGFVMGPDSQLEATVDEFLAQNLPFLDVASIREGRTGVGLAGLVALVVAGVGWVEAIRSSQRLIWGLDQRPGNAILRRLIDVALLLVLAVLLGASVALANGVEWLLTWLPSAAQTALGWVLTVGVLMVLTISLLAAVPRLRISPRRLLPSAVLVAMAIFLLNSLGGTYLRAVEDRYRVVAVAAGLLVYLYLLHQVLLLGAALAATSRHGAVVDLAASPEEEPADRG